MDEKDKKKNIMDELLEDDFFGLPVDKKKAPAPKKTDTKEGMKEAAGKVPPAPQKTPQKATKDAIFDDFLAPPEEELTKKSKVSDEILTDYRSTTEKKEKIVNLIEEELLDKEKKGAKVSTTKIPAVEPPKVEKIEKTPRFTEAAEPKKEVKEVVKFVPKGGSFAIPFFTGFISGIALMLITSFILIIGGVLKLPSQNNIKSEKDIRASIDERTKGSNQLPPGSKTTKPELGENVTQSPEGVQQPASPPETVAQGTVAQAPQGAQQPTPVPQPSASPPPAPQPALPPSQQPAPSPAVASLASEKYLLLFENLPSKQKADAVASLIKVFGIKSNIKANTEATETYRVYLTQTFNSQNEATAKGLKLEIMDIKYRVVREGGVLKILAGEFSSKAKAQEIKRTLDSGGMPATVETVQKKTSTFTLKSDVFISKDDAEKALNSISKKGYKGKLIRAE